MRFLARLFSPTGLYHSVMVGAVVLLGFFLLRNQIVTSIYQDKVAALAADYTALAEQYNLAVQRTAVTELEVGADSLAVRIRTLDGEIRLIPTPFDPRHEIFVDYLVGDGRIWIRRVFDQSTPPERALVIDPLWADADWSKPGLSHGQAIYRALRPGVWSIQVSGNGALSLEPRDRSLPEQLVAKPPVRSFEEMQMELQQDVGAIGLEDIWHFCTGWMCR